MIELAVNSSSSLFSLACAKQMATDQINQFYAEMIRRKVGDSITSTRLYEDYCGWCERRGLAPLWLSEYFRLFHLMGIEKARVAGRVRYLGVVVTDDREIPDGSPKSHDACSHIADCCFKRRRHDFGP